MNSSSSRGGASVMSQPVKQPVGIIKKTSSYRPPVMYQQRGASTCLDAITSASGVATTNLDDLAVVGVSSNMYRDDFMALKLESRDILIPWNGNQNLLIDRYDCRGYLYDLAPYDADLMSEERRNPKQTNEEIEIERACDLERYMFLKEDNEEPIEPKDNDNEDHKSDSTSQDHGSSSKRYASIGFVYDSATSENHQAGSGNSKQQQSEPQSPSGKEKIFIPDESLQLPVGMLVPETVKMNQIVVKTASFVAKQGLQMEILLKTKQAANSQFDFLNFDNHLNPYYKHLIQLIRDKKIDPLVYLVETKEDDKKSNEDDEEDADGDEDDNYLHPLLFKKIETPQPLLKLAAQSPPVQNKIDASENKQVTNGKDRDELAELAEQEKEQTRIEKSEKPIDVPEGVQKTIIDKLAEYVSRNGREFEQSIAKKNDERFEFLSPAHKYHAYYCEMIEQALKRATSCSRGDAVENKKDTEVAKKIPTAAEVVRPKDEHRKRRSRSRSRAKMSSSSSSSSDSDGTSSSSECEDKKGKESTSKRKKRKKEKEKKKEKSNHKKSSHHHHHHKSKKSKYRKRSKDRH